MKLHAKKKKHGDYWDTYCEAAEVELDNCRVFFDSSPPEPDVGYGGGLDLESVEYQGRDVLPDMSKAEEEGLLERLSEHLNAWAEDERY